MLWVGFILVKFSIELQTLKSISKPLDVEDLGFSLPSLLINPAMVIVHPFRSPHFASMVAYLANIFSLMNDLNLLLQEMKVGAATTGDLMRIFKQKLLIWSRRILQKIFANFSLLYQVLSRTNQLCRRCPQGPPSVISKLIICGDCLCIWL